MRFIRLLLVAVAVLISAVACGGTDRGAYINANEAVFEQLPHFPGAKLRQTISAPARAEEDGPIVGYTTRYDFDLPQSAEPGDVATFYRQRLEPKWRLVERVDGPVLNFRKGSAFVSVNLASWRAHQLELAVDHAYER
jgi:hypothetical protein